MVRPRRRVRPRPRRARRRPPRGRGARGRHVGRGALVPAGRARRPRAFPRLARPARGPGLVRLDLCRPAGRPGSRPARRRMAVAATGCFRGASCFPRHRRRGPRRPPRPAFGWARAAAAGRVGARPRPARAAAAPRRRPAGPASLRRIVRRLCFPGWSARSRPQPPRSQRRSDARQREHGDDEDRDSSRPVIRSCTRPLRPTVSVPPPAGSRNAWAQLPSRRLRTGMTPCPFSAACQPPAGSASSRDAAGASARPRRKPHSDQPTGTMAPDG